jgi:aspartate kinase
MAIQSMGHAAVSFTGAQVGIVTDSTHTKARIRNISTGRLRQALEDGNIVIVAGFQGTDEQGNITTLGRGGSDTTAVALAAVMKHDPAGQNADTACEIYTDVDGVFTTDPRIVPEAKKLPVISYDEMLELASLGAGVMHSRSIEFAKKFAVPLQVRSSFSDVEGTWIVPEASWMQEAPVIGAAVVRDEARVRLAGVPDKPGLVHRVFASIAARNIVVDMIAASVDPHGLAEIGFTIPKSELREALATLGTAAKALGGAVTASEDHSKVSVVGVGMKTHTGVAEDLFTALAEEGISVKMVSTSDIKISVLVDKADGPRALRAVHQCFGLHALPLSAEAAAAGRDAARKAALGPGPGGRDLTPLLAAMEDIVVSDVLLDATQGQLTIVGLSDQPGTCAQIFSAVALAGIVVDMIVYNVNDDGTAELSFTVPRADVARAREQTERALQRIAPAAALTAVPDVAKVIVDGVGMRTHTGTARRMFAALAERGINIRTISTSETRVTVLVDLAHGEQALTVLRQAFPVA